ncbi:MAG: hypothetical protein IH867_07435 [Chloroflexi bacterium]|nr:hypothetical protein [Chloroflexota bacterium]
MARNLNTDHIDSRTHAHLYIDVDDTLVQYSTGGQHPYGVVYGEAWNLNVALMRAVDGWLQKYPSEVRIWSGGGAEYAMQVFGKVKNEVPFSVTHFASKHDLEPEDQSCGSDRFVFVDDDPMSIIIEMGWLGHDMTGTGPHQVFEVQDFIDHEK